MTKMQRSPVLYGEQLNDPAEICSLTRTQSLKSSEAVSYNIMLTSMFARNLNIEIYTSRAGVSGV